MTGDAARVRVASIGLAGPGLGSWSSSQPVLRGESEYLPAEMPRYAPGLLPPNERRRATRLCRLAFKAAEEAIHGSTLAPDQLAAVFASSGGDYEVMDRMCRALCRPEREMSPTDFHNSVHNAAAGYWSIATHSRQPSTSLSAFDSSFAAGLLEAACLVMQERQPVLLVTYDTRPPAPLVFERPLANDFSTALVLAPCEDTDSMRLGLSFDDSTVGETTVSNEALETLRLGNPAGRALPLLCALAAGRGTQIGLPYFGRCIAVELEAC